VLAPGGLRAETERQYLAAGIPVFHDTAVCLDAVACCQAWVATPAPAPAPAPPGTGPALPAEIGQALRAAAAAGRGVLDEAESARVLGLCGIAMVESRQYGSLGEAREAAEGLSYPVVLKALAPGLMHKRAHGLVATRIADAAGLRAAAIRIGEHLAALGHGGEVATLVQPMIAAEAEIILGVSHEPPLGHFLLAGLGGILAEALDEVILLPIPAGADPVRRRIAESRLGAVLAAVDAGGGALDRIVAMLSCLERLVLAHGGLIETVDLNPVLVGTGGVVAVDAALVLRAADTAAAT
jgi:acyl-CoA synthetase (NDP forming)